MRILITNDDGIRAPQLARLARWARRLGEVTVVAPKYEQSGKSQAFQIHDAFEVKPFDLEPGIPAWSVDSTPADCIRYAMLGMKQSFDLILSGINRGYNMGSDILYSGTVGAAFEAVLLGAKAVALSTGPEYYDQAADHLDQVFDFIFDHDLLQIHSAYNVNIPPHAQKLRITRQGGPYYSDDFVSVGDNLYQASGKCVYTDSNNDDLDTDAIHHGYISVMPLTVCRTDLEVFRKLKTIHE